MALFRWESEKHPDPYYTFTFSGFTDQVLETFLKFNGSSCNGALATQVAIELRLAKEKFTEDEQLAFQSLLIVGAQPLASVWRDARETLRARERARIQLAMDREVK